MIRIKPLHTRIFNSILSLVTIPQCGSSVYVSHRVLLTHCQEPFSGRPTKLLCALMPWWLFPLDPQCPALICCTTCVIVLTSLHATGWKMSLVGWKKRLKDSGTAESLNLPLGAITVLLYCAAFPLLFLFFFADAVLWGSVMLSCCSPVSSRPHLRSR